MKLAFFHIPVFYPEPQAGIVDQFLRNHPSGIGEKREERYADLFISVLEES